MLVRGDPAPMNSVWKLDGRKRRSNERLDAGLGPRPVGDVAPGGLLYKLCQRQGAAAVGQQRVRPSDLRARRPYVQITEQSEGGWPHCLHFPLRPVRSRRRQGATFDLCERRYQRSRHKRRTDYRAAGRPPHALVLACSRGGARFRHSLYLEQGTGSGARNAFLIVFNTSCAGPKELQSGCLNG